MRLKKVGIVGGGPGGLMAAYFLERMADAPVEITLFEASSRLGGKIITPSFDSAPVRYEAGAAEFYDYDHFDYDPLKELIAGLGLSISVMGGSAVIMDDQIISNLEDVEQFLGAAARQEIEAFDRRARDLMIPAEFYHSDHPEGYRYNLTPDDTSFDPLIEAMADPAARRFMRTVMHSDLATEPRHTNVAYGLQNYLMNDEAYMRLYGIVGGNEQLPQQLAARINAEILLEHTVQRIGKHGERYQIDSQIDGVQRQDEFDFVIVALPPNHVPSLAFEGAGLADAVQRHQGHYNHPAHYLRITLLFTHRFWQQKLTDSFWMLDHFGGCCLYDESSRQPDVPHGILGWLLGGDPALEMCEWDDQKLIDAALDSLPSFLPDGRQCFLEGKVHRWQASVNAQPGGDVMHSHDKRHVPEPADHPELFFVGDYLYDTTLNGVLDSAHYVASWIAAQLSPEAHREV